MVMPRSRSRSIESRYCSRISLGSTAPVSSRMRSDRVDLPWSTWLMIEKLRIRSVATGPDCVTGVTVPPSYRPPSTAPDRRPGRERFEAPLLALARPEADLVAVGVDVGPLPHVVLGVPDR